MSNPLPPLKLDELIQIMLSNLYMIKKGGKYKLTEKFQQEAASPGSGQELVLAGEQAGLMAISKEEWTMKFIDFIQKASVPVKVVDPRGNPYYTNKFSDLACAAFKELLLSGVNEDLLIASTALYYKSNVAYKKAIGNYILQGDWRTDYKALKESAEQGSEHLTKHIKDTADGGGNKTGWALG